MKLMRLRLNNIRCFENLDISFINENTNQAHPVIVITGENGSGKTTLLKSIVSCMTMNHAVYAGDIFQTSDVRMGANYSSIAVIPNFSKEETKFFSDNGWHGNFEMSQWIVQHPTEIDGQKVQPANDVFLYDDDTSNPINFSNFKEIFENPSFPGGLIFSFDSYRVIPKSKLSGPNAQPLPPTIKHWALSSSVNDNLYFNDRFLFVKQWIMNIDYHEAKLFRDKKVDGKLFSTIKDSMNLFLAPFEFSKVNEVGGILFKTSLGEIDLDDLSEGTKSLFVLIGELLFRYSLPYIQEEVIDVEEMLHTESVVLIDEIESHLHPKLQVNVVPMLRNLFPNTQFIITTNSPLIAQSVKPEEVFRLGAEM